MSSRDGGRSAVLFAVGTTISGSLPVFLLGALFVQIQESLAAPDWALGVSVAVYWGAAALVSLASGRIIGVLGVWWATVLSIALAAGALAGSWCLASTWQMLAVWAAVGGAANALGHPASNGMLTSRVAARRAATALGIKQGAVPIASFLAGLSVPIVAIAFGWKWGFGLAALVTVLLAGCFLLWGPRRRGGERRRRGDTALSPALRRYLLQLTCATTLGAGAAGAIASYAVTAGVDRGVDLALAGGVLSAGSLCGAVVRIVSGRAADRTAGRIALPLASSLLAIGGVGALLMAMPDPLLFSVGVVLALGIGWGWTGLTHYVVSRMAGASTPSATGLVQTGSYAGSGGGPLLFGVAFSFVGGTGIWVCVAAAQVIAAILLLRLARRPEKSAVDFKTE